MYQHLIESHLKKSLEAKTNLLDQHVDTILRMSAVLVESFRKGGKLLVMGNGGSASDAQHMVAECLGRFKKERRALPAIALTANSSTTTAIANDYGYEDIFRRQVEGLARDNDVLLGLTTSGRSANVLKAIDWAKDHGISTLGLTGEAGEDFCQRVDIGIAVASKDTAIIQESHICIIHILCDLIEQGAVS